MAYQNGLFGTAFGGNSMTLFVSQKPMVVFGKRIQSIVLDNIVRGC